jgi:large subunit ribosomal protein L10
MALTKQKKQEIVTEVQELLDSSKMTVITKYQGTSVKSLQQLRQQGQENGTTLKVIKNRLVKKAIEANDTLKEVDTTQLSGMLLYAFNMQDEVAPAQVLAKFAKTEPSIEFVGAISAEGKFLTADEVKSLSVLPGKEQLIAGIASTLQSPTRGVIGSLSSQITNIISGLEAKAQA